MIRCVDDDSGAAAVGKVVGAAVGLDVVMVFDVPVTLTLTPLAWSAAGNDQRCDGQGGKKLRKTPCALIKYEQDVNVGIDIDARLRRTDSAAAMNAFVNCFLTVAWHEAQNGKDASGSQSRPP